MVSKYMLYYIKTCFGWMIIGLLYLSSSASCKMFHLQINDVRVAFTMPIEGENSKIWYQILSLYSSQNLEFSSSAFERYFKFNTFRNQVNAWSARVGGSAHVLSVQIVSCV